MKGVEEAKAGILKVMVKRIYLEENPKTEKVSSVTTATSQVT